MPAPARSLPLPRRQIRHRGQAANNAPIWYAKTRTLQGGGLASNSPAARRSNSACMRARDVHAISVRLPHLQDPPVAMAKSKNHTSHNQSNKAHKNGASEWRPSLEQRAAVGASSCAAASCAAAARLAAALLSSPRLLAGLSRASAALVGVQQPATATPGLATPLFRLAGRPLRRHHRRRRRSRLAAALRPLRPPRPRVGIWPPLAPPPALTRRSPSLRHQEGAQAALQLHQGGACQPGLASRAPPRLICFACSAAPPPAHTSCRSDGAQVPAQRQVRAQAQRQGTQHGGIGPPRRPPSCWRVACASGCSCDTEPLCHASVCVLLYAAPRYALRKP